MSYEGQRPSSTSSSSSLTGILSRSAWNIVIIQGREGAPLSHPLVTFLIVIITSSYSAKKKKGKKGGEEKRPTGASKGRPPTFPLPRSLPPIRLRRFHVVSEKINYHHPDRSLGKRWEKLTSVEMGIFAKWNSEIRKNARSNNNIRVFVTRRWLFKESLSPFFFLKREREDILFSGERDRPWNDMNNDRANHSFPRFYLRSLCLKQIRIHPPHPRAFENLTRANR